MRRRRHAKRRSPSWRSMFSRPSGPLQLVSGRDGHVAPGHGVSAGADHSRPHKPGAGDGRLLPPGGSAIGAAVLPRSARAGVPGVHGPQRPRLVVELAGARNSLGAERDGGHRQSQVAPPRFLQRRCDLRRREPRRPFRRRSPGDRPTRPRGIDPPRQRLRVESIARGALIDEAASGGPGLDRRCLRRPERGRSHRRGEQRFRAGGLRRRARCGRQPRTDAPWSSSYNTAPRWAIIDHILVRNGRPLSGDVFDFGAWSIDDEVARIEANFLNTGSDHFPIGGSAEL
jgi:hypothetical protein